MSIRPEVVLLGGAGGMGLLALLFPLLFRVEAPPRQWWGRWAVALGAIALLFGLTRLREYPFSPGGTLGEGLAVGGIAALITAALAARWTGIAETTVGASGGALLGGVVVLLWHPGYPNAALVGFAAGHALATLLASAGDEEDGRAGLWAGPIAAALLAGAVLLAIDRAEEMRPAERLAMSGKVWWIWPAVVMAATLGGQMVGLSLLARRAGGFAGAALVAALLLILLWLRFPSYGPLMAPMAAGFVTALLLLGCSSVEVLRRWGVGVLGRSDVEDGQPQLRPASRMPDASTPQRLNALPALVAPALVVVLLATAYRLYTGYGIALAALGALVLLPWLAEREPRALGRALFGLLAAGVLFRVYYNSYDLRGSDIPLTAHYAMVGLIAGALAPFALGAIQLSGAARREDSCESPGSRSLGIALLGLVAAVALPALLAVYWGQKAGGGLLLGLVVGQAFRLMSSLLEAEAPGQVAAVAAHVPDAALLVMAWVTVQLLDRIATYGLQLLRLQRVGLIAALVVICFLMILYRAWRPAPTVGVNQAG